MVRRDPKRKILEDRWYLVDTINKQVPRLTRSDYKNKQDIITFINNQKKGNLRWDYISGKEAIALGLKFKQMTSVVDKQRPYIYNYPPECITNQDKKSYRTDQRRNEKKSRKRDR